MQTGGKEPFSGYTQTDKPVTSKERHPAHADQRIKKATQQADMATGSGRYLRYILFAFFVSPQ